ncbi:MULTISPECIES: nuclear transport factor 2 family protein [unclassified Desulfovibrio]|uniref:nuclear transport factor 2 family protein n=1 Tax=unclassified Desulfovibrio TaxID=2593640 RepID=UPI0013EB9C8B|nr:MULTISPECIES: nuclear transport factor 2 family protein [unclassified Desulfovibrio]
MADLSEYKAIVRTLETYRVEGCAANVAGGKRAFHEKAVMNGSGKDGYVLGPAHTLYDLYGQVGPAPDAIWHIDVLDRAGNTAIGRIVIKNWHGKDFVDCHELIKENGEWKIIAKTAQELEERPCPNLPVLRVRWK